MWRIITSKPLNLFGWIVAYLGQTQNSGGLQQQPALPSSGNHQATNTSSDEDESGPVSEEIPGVYKGPMPLGGINLLKKFEAFRPNFKLDPNVMHKPS